MSTEITEKHGKKPIIFSVFSVLLSVHFLFFVHVFGPLSLPRRGYIS
ncbi:MAG: hypothetical protein BECKG1743F_GA0114225_107421, partial [Candidatus Kentron sp. G]